MPQQMCTKCQQFYGNPQNNNMCSGCYKQEVKLEKIQEQANKFEVPQINNSKQDNHNRCFICSKKVGLLGFLCKGCSCTFCKSHRIPEDHSCDYDYLEKAKKKIEKENPNITSAKIEEI